MPQYVRPTGKQARIECLIIAIKYQFSLFNLVRTLLLDHHPSHTYTHYPESGFETYCTCQRTAFISFD